MPKTPQYIIEEIKTEIKSLLSNSKTGLKDTSNTNKTRYHILALIDDLLQKKGEEEREYSRRLVVGAIVLNHDSSTGELINAVNNSLEKDL